MNRVVVCAALVALTFGCGPTGRRVVWVPVRGSVTCDGKPVAAGTVQFHDAVSGESPQADLRPDGSFEAKIPAASYVVTVVPLLVNTSGDGMPNWEEKRADDIPAKYRLPAKSGLKAEVPADGSKAEFTFALARGK